MWVLTVVSAVVSRSAISQFDPAATSNRTPVRDVRLARFQNMVARSPGV